MQLDLFLIMFLNLIHNLKSTNLIDFNILFQIGRSILKFHKVNFQIIKKVTNSFLDSYIILFNY